MLAAIRSTGMITDFAVVFALAITVSLKAHCLLCQGDKLQELKPSIAPQQDDAPKFMDFTECPPPDAPLLGYLSSHFLF